MKALNSVYYVTKFGGLKLLYIYMHDKFCKSSKKQEAIYKIIENIRPEDYERKLAEYYQMSTLRRIDIQKPRTFNEKIQWLKLHDPMNEMKTKLADKYMVREWIEEKAGEEYLIPLLGVWNNISEVDLETLPDRFVLKTNHGCGTTMIITNKADADWDKIKVQYDEWLATNYAFVSFEPHYKDIEPKIIAEKYIEQNDGNLYDYKIHCFNGKPLYILVIGDRDLKHHTGMGAIYDVEWNLQSFTTNSYPIYEKAVSKPQKLEEMLKLAEILSKDFSYVRVDLYELDDGSIKFGEMTFTPSSGMYDWNPPEMDAKWGEIVRLPKE